MSNYIRRGINCFSVSLTLLLSSFSIANAETAVGTISGEFSVSPSGGATYTIPIEVPPGINGLQPSLALVYNSQAGNGLLGMGWSLSGLSSITRCPKTLAQDGVIHGVDFTNADRLCLDGQRLVLKEGDSSNDNTYWASNAEYRTEVESFSKVTRYGAGFKVETKDGRVAEYGSTTDSAQNVKIINTSSEPVLSWAVSKISDQSGNSISYQYYENIGSGDFHLASISYNDNTNIINFDYGMRTDITQMYHGGSMSKTSMRLTGIRVCTDSACTQGSTLVRQYILDYDNNGSAESSRLTSVRECGKNGACFPAKIFEWQYNNIGFAPASEWANGNNWAGLGWVGYDDFNGDGRQDIWYVPSGTSRVMVRLNTGLGFAAASEWANGNRWAGLGWFGFTDFDGDGRADFWYVTASSSQVMVRLNTGRDFAAASEWANGNRWAGLGWFGFTDFDGDGRADFWYVTASSSQVMVRLNTGLGFASASEWANGNRWGGLGWFGFTELDGDGRVDFWYVTASSSQVMVRLNTGRDFAAASEWANNNNWAGLGWVGFADFNGDGKQDIWYVPSGTSRVMVRLNTGLGFAAASEWANGNRWGGLGWFGFTELNGDGRVDFWYVTASSSQVMVRLNTGQDFAVASEWANNNNWAGLAWVGFADFNGDGKQDIWYVPSGTSRVMVRTANTSFPNLLITVKDDLDVKVSISYTPISDNSIYTKDTIDNPYGYKPSYPIMDYQGPIQVVTSVSANNALGSQNTSTYKYGGLKVHKRGLGNLGFRWIESIDETGLKSYSEFSQDYHSLGIPLLTTQSLNGVELTRSVVVANTDITRISYSGVTLNSYGDMQNERWFSYVNKNTTTKRDLNGASLGKTVTEVTLDEFGNEDYKVVTTISDAGETYRQVVDNEFGKKYAPAAWYEIGQLTGSQSHSEANGVPSGTLTAAYTYHANSLLATETVEPNTSKWLTKAYGYDAFGNRTSVTVSGADIPTRISTTTYDSNGQFPVSIKNAMGHEETRVYDPRFGVITSQTGPNGLTTIHEYDEFGRQTATQTASGNRSEITREWCITNCVVPAITTSSLAQTVSYTVTTRQKGGPGLVEFVPPRKVYFDKLNREVRRESVGFDGTSIYVDTNYDAQGRVVAITAPYFSDDVIHKNPARYEYDDLGRVEHSYDAAGTHTEIARNGLETTYTTEVQNSYRVETRVETHNVIGQLVSVRDNANQLLQFGYNPQGQRTTTTDPNGNVVTIEYDKFGRKWKMDDPDMGHWEYGYNVLGELIHQMDAKNQITTMQYDVLGRMTRRNDHDGLVSEWHYNDNLIAGNTPRAKAIGKLDTETSSNGYRNELYYDNFGRPQYNTITIGGTTSYRTDSRYDDYGRLDVLSYPDSVGRFEVKHVYKNGFLHKVTSLDGLIEYWRADVRDAHGQVQSDHYGNNLQIMRTFDAAGRINWLNIGDTSTLYQAYYSYDSIGNLTQRKSQRNQGSGVELVEDYVYDNLNRLTRIDSSHYAPMVMDYDGQGNITNKTGIGAYTYYDNRPHAVETAASNTYNYDANGNMINGAGRTVAWASYNKPIRIENAQAESLFSYGPGRARFLQIQTDKATGNNKITHYVGGLFERIRNPNGVYDYKHYIRAGGQTIAVHTRSSNSLTDTEYLLRDYQGTVVAVANASGQIKGSMDYDAFGARRPILGQSVIDQIIESFPRGYTGHEHLDKLGLIHMNGRVYDPQLGRFLSADPIVQAPTNLQSLNRYSYVMNNPMSYTDPSGYKRWRKRLRRLGNRLAKVTGVITSIGLRVNSFTGWAYTKPVKNFMLDNEWARSSGGVIAGIFGPATAGLYASYLADISGASYENIGKSGLTTGAIVYIIHKAADAYSMENGYNNASEQLSKNLNKIDSYFDINFEGITDWNILSEGGSDKLREQLSKELLKSIDEKLTEKTGIPLLRPIIRAMISGESSLIEESLRSSLEVSVRDSIITHVNKRNSDNPLLTNLFMPLAAGSLVDGIDGRYEARSLATASEGFLKDAALDGLERNYKGSAIKYLENGGKIYY